MSRSLAKTVHLYLREKGYNAEIGWFDENLFFFSWQRKRCYFLGQLVKEMRLFTLVQPLPSIQTPQSLANRQVSKETQTSDSTEKKDIVNSV